MLSEKPSPEGESFDKLFHLYNTAEKTHLKKWRTDQSLLGVMERVRPGGKSVCLEGSNVRDTMVTEMFVFSLYPCQHSVCDTVLQFCKMLALWTPGQRVHKTYLYYFLKLQVCLQLSQIA